MKTLQRIILSPPMGYDPVLRRIRAGLFHGDPTGTRPRPEQGLAAEKIYKPWYNGERSGVETLKILIAYATKYGSTRLAATWMAEHLRSKADVDLLPVEEVDCSLSPYTHIILGSPLYGDDLLPEMKEFIQERDPEFAGKAVGVFGVALHRLGEGLYGNPDGGLAYFERFFYYLPVKPIFSRFLGGALYPERLTKHDRQLLQEFFALHGEDEIPFIQELNRRETREFADKFLQLAAVKQRLKSRIQNQKGD